MRNASFDLNQVLECHFQADFREKNARRSRALLPEPDVQALFLLQDKGKPIVAGAGLTPRAGFAGLREGDVHGLCLIRATRTEWGLLLFDGERRYEDRQSLCSLSETIV